MLIYLTKFASCDRRALTATTRITMSIAKQSTMSMSSSALKTLSEIMEWCVATFTILAAASGVIFVVASHRLKAVETVLAEAKDRQIADNLKAKDVLIGNANAEAARANASAGLANGEAGRANERTAKIEHDNLALRGQIAPLETTAAEARKEVAGLQAAAAGQQERAAVAEKSLLELQQRFEPRHLNENDKKRLTEFWSANPKGDLTVYWADTPECAHFALELRSVLEAAGWTIQKDAGPFLGGVPPGITIPVPNLKNAAIRAKSLQDGLKLIGINAPAFETKDLSKEVVLMIGPKEQPAESQRRK